MKPLTKDKEILEMKEELPGFTSFAQAMGNAGRKVKKPSGKSLFYKSDVKQALEFLNEEIDKRIDAWKEVHTKADTKDRKDGCETIVNVLYDIKKLINDCFPAFKEE